MRNNDIEKLARNDAFRKDLYATPTDAELESLWKTCSDFTEADLDDQERAAADRVKTWLRDRIAGPRLTVKDVFFPAIGTVIKNVGNQFGRLWERGEHSVAQPAWAVVGGPAFLRFAGGAAAGPGAAPVDRKPANIAVFDEDGIARPDMAVCVNKARITHPDSDTCRLDVDLATTDERLANRRIVLLVPAMGEARADRWVAWEGALRSTSNGIEERFAADASKLHPEQKEGALDPSRMRLLIQTIDEGTP